MKLVNKALAVSVPALILSWATPSLAEVVNFTLLHLNDIYEIAPVEGGTRGGLARVATIKKQLQTQNPRTYTILAGDFLSPSALGTAKVNNQPLAGQQMVAVLNQIGLDFATFGNHEFDLPKEAFYQRLKEAKFKFFSGNVFDSQGQPFPNVNPYQIIEIKTNEGKIVKVGLIGVTINSNKKDYVTYRDALATTKEQVKVLKERVDIIIAVTHLSITEDRQIAELVPEIDVILGGHEHENIQQWRGRDFTPIYKADANARSVYIHNLTFDTESRNLSINAKLQPVTEAIPEDPQTAKLVNEWVQKGFNAFRAQGFSPDKKVTTTKVALDGLESHVRNQSTNLTEILANSMLKEVENADLAVFNSGSIRIDDVIPPGVVTEYDVIRTLPFGGKVLGVEIDGSLLEKMLIQGQVNLGRGGYLQTANVSKDEKTGKWLIGGKLLETKRNYRIAINDFLVSGQERDLEFINLKEPGIKLITEKRDIRFVLIDGLRNSRL
ncbi:bifunctional metallophosphatase/5'-nucleotidase [Merismopedia glauca CCAP 1448/3]|uniref:Bifunctional metallophosphatase/5'-nucleotidase n=2 Tax=Merismopedia TaxID=53402 RepID=A0A2T1C3Q2_9CYAN|nr:bifunctional metallophosphatase/5'-nucleotidase [Merismopedia glauca CCAP 1448/3]